MDKIPTVVTDLGNGYLFIPAGQQSPPPERARRARFDDSFLEGKEAKGCSTFFAKKEGPLSNVPAPRELYAKSKELLELEKATLKKKQQVLVHLHGDEAEGSDLAAFFAQKHRKEFSCTWIMQSKKPQLLLISYQQLAHRLNIRFDPTAPFTWLCPIVHKFIDRLPSPPLLIFISPNKIPQLPDRGVALFVSQNNLDLSPFEEDSFSLVPDLSDGDAEALEPSTLVSMIEVPPSKKEKTPISLKTPQTLIASAKGLSPEKGLDDWVAFSYLREDLFDHREKILSIDPSVIMKLGQYESIAGRFQIADTILRRALEQCKKQIPQPPHQLLESRPEVAVYLLAIAENLNRSGKNKEIFRTIEEATRIYTSIYGRDHLFLAQCRLLYGKATYEYAKSLYPETTEIQLKTQQKDKGFSPKQAEKEKEKYEYFAVSIDQLNEAYRLFVRFGMNTGFDFARCISYLGKVHHSMRDFQKAEKFHNQATQILRSLDAPLSVIAESVEDLGKTKFELNRYKEAVALFKENLNLQKRIFPNSERVLQALHLLILTLIQDKQNQEVVKYHQEGIQLKKKLGYTPSLKENVFYHLGTPIVSILESMKII